MVNDAGRPISNAVIHVRNDTSGRDIDHDITSGELAEYGLFVTAVTEAYVCWF